MGAADFQKASFETTRLKNAWRIYSKPFRHVGNSHLSELVCKVKLDLQILSFRRCWDRQSSLLLHQFLEVILIENAYLPACDDLLNELSGQLGKLTLSRLRLGRRQLVAAGLQNRGLTTRMRLESSVRGSNPTFGRLRRRSGHLVLCRSSS